VYWQRFNVQSKRILLADFFLSPLLAVERYLFFKGLRFFKLLMNFLVLKVCSACSIRFVLDEAIKPLLVTRALLQMFLFDLVPHFPVGVVIFLTDNFIFGFEGGSIFG